MAIAAKRITTCLEIARRLTVAGIPYTLTFDGKNEGTVETRFAEVLEEVLRQVVELNI